MGRGNRRSLGKHAEAVGQVEMQTMKLKDDTKSAQTASGDMKENTAKGEGRRVPSGKPMSTKQAVEKVLQENDAALRRLADR